MLWIQPIVIRRFQRRSDEVPEGRAAPGVSLVCLHLVECLDTPYHVLRDPPSPRHDIATLDAPERKC